VLKLLRTARIRCAFSAALVLETREGPASAVLQYQTSCFAKHIVVLFLVAKLSACNVECPYDLSFCVGFVTVFLSLEVPLCTLLPERSVFSDV
jgi:hypothetical protein